MEPTRLERLTERERAYLRLVYNAMSSKEIALRYGVEPGTVDKALKSAMAKLGTSSRRSAARLLAEAEQPQKLAPQSERLVPPPQFATMAPSNEDWDWSRRRAVREEQVPYLAGFPSQLQFPIPRYEGDRNELAPSVRLAWIGAIALGIVVIASALIAIAWGAARMVGPLL